MGQPKTPRKFQFFIILLLIGSCQSCNSDKTKDSTVASSDRKSDSVNLRNQLITIYKWYEKNEGINHNNFLTESYGIDTVKLDSVIKEMSKTDFFSKEFLTNYKQIGQRTNQMLKQDSTLRMVGIAFPFQDYDTWNGSQGTVPGWMNDLTITDLSISANTATFKWMVKNSQIELGPMEVKFKREGSQWKLTFLQYMDLKMYQ